MQVKFDKEKFGAYYNALDEKAKRRLRDDFLKAAGLQYPSWYTKRMRGTFTPLEMKELERITGEDFSCSES